MNDQSISQSIISARLLIMHTDEA